MPGSIQCVLGAGMVIYLKDRAEALDYVEEQCQLALQMSFVELRTLVGAGYLTDTIAEVQYQLWSSLLGDD